MPDPHVISALADKAHELRQAIVSYEERLDRTRKELAVASATLAIMQRDGGLLTDSKPAAIRNLFKRGEPLALCKTALAEAPDGMTTRAFGVVCLRTRGFDHEDPVLIRAMVGAAVEHTEKGGAAAGDGAGRVGGADGGVAVAGIVRPYSDYTSSACAFRRSFRRCRWRRASFFMSHDTEVRI